MRLATTVFLFVACGGDPASAPGSLSSLLEHTTWTCRWITLNAPLYEYPSVSYRVEVEHTLEFTATTLTDDLPARLEEWAADTTDTYAKDQAYLTGFNGLGTAEVVLSMDDVTWTAVSDDQILFSVRDTQGRFSGNVAMTIRWDAEGMWTERRYLGLASYSRCTRTSPPAETGG